MTAGIRAALVTVAALALAASAIETALPEGKLRNSAVKSIALVTLLAAARAVMSALGII